MHEYVWNYFFIGFVIYFLAANVRNDNWVLELVSVLVWPISILIGVFTTKVKQ